MASGTASGARFCANLYVCAYHLEPIFRQLTISKRRCPCSSPCPVLATALSPHDGARPCHGGRAGVPLGTRDEGCTFLKSDILLFENLAENTSWTDAFKYGRDRSGPGGGARGRHTKMQFGAVSCFAEDWQFGACLLELIALGVPGDNRDDPGVAT